MKFDKLYRALHRARLKTSRTTCGGLTRLRHMSLNSSKPAADNVRCRCLLFTANLGFGLVHSGFQGAVLITSHRCQVQSINS